MEKGKVEYIVLTFLIEQEGPFYVSKCLELGVASFGDDEKEAYENLADAVEVYLDTLEDLGTACFSSCRYLPAGTSKPPWGVFGFEPGMGARPAVFRGDD